MLGPREDGGGLRARPLERLLDLGPSRVGELGRLMARLLEQAGALRLRLPQLGGRLGVGARHDLPRLLVRGAHDLAPLALGLLAVALEVSLLRLELALAPPNLLLRPAELRRRGALGVALERVGELGRGADEVERVHPDEVARRLDPGRAPGRLHHP